MTISQPIVGASLVSSAEAARRSIDAWAPSTSFGIDSRGAARDRRSLFAAAGTRWNEDLFPHPDDARGSDYPFSYDVSDGRFLAAIDAGGLARRVVRGDGMRSVEGASIPGVYVEKEFGYVEGAFGVVVDGAGLASSTLLSEVVPAFVTTDEGLSVHRIITVERRSERSALRCTVVIDNGGEADREVSLEMVASAVKGTLCAAWADGVEDVRRAIAVPAGQVGVCAAEFAFDPDPADAAEADPDGLLRAVDDRIRSLSHRYGDLRIDGGGVVRRLPRSFCGARSAEQPARSRRIQHRLLLG